MKNRFHSLNGQSGVSLAETLIVVVIIAVVATLAYMKMGTANTRFQRQNVARELKVAFERARFDSVKRHAEGAGPATVTVDSNSYTVQTDQNQDGTFQSSESVVTNFAAQNITISGYTTMTLPVIVTFDKRGETEAVDVYDAVIIPQFLVCNVSCSTPTVANANLLIVTPTGTVNMLGGGDPPPTFTNPPATSVSATTGINDLVRLP